ncbi:macrolide family glycosyltransferase [uncultured Agrococcus sp.]|uniref:macrolide family glycosyltransferase n=1 Tax=uncultured Agrococcus sp. TaxID=382258 RepID=UPI0025CB867F|nr:macrolide family glycosyltransferase [uncultured Agrococcus sp.]
MARILFTGPLGHGHINPTLGIANELVERGHDVVYAAPEPFESAISGTGAKYVPLRSKWSEMGEEAGPQFHGQAFAKASELALVETKHMTEQLDALRADGRLQRPDVIVHDGPVAWWGRGLGHDWEVPTVETWPNFVSNRHWNMQKYIKVNPIDPVFLRFLWRLRRFLRSRGVSGVAGFMQGASAADRVVTVPRAFQPSGRTFGEGFSFVGPVLTDRAHQGSWKPPAEAAGRPILLVSLGTAYHDRPDFFRMVTSSTAGRDWHVVMSIGDRVDPAVLEPVPSNVEIMPFVPQLAVLEHASVFVTHAGMGGTVEALNAGVPMVAVPQMAEQRANADRIEELDLGLALDPGNLDADAFWHIVDSVGHRAKFAARSEWMQAEIQQSGGAPAAADVIEAAV